VAAHPATLLTLVLSDVIGDPPEIIASGPTVPDPSTYAEAWSILERHGLQARVPSRVATHLRRGLRGEIPESPKPGDPRLARSHTAVIGNLHEALIAAQATAQRLGYRSTLLTETLQGDAVAAAHHLAHIALNEERSTKERRCLLAGGETTVQVLGKGKGGRNQHLALAFARRSLATPASRSLPPAPTAPMVPPTLPAPMSMATPSPAPARWGSTPTIFSRAAIPIRFSPRSMPSPGTAATSVPGRPGRT